MKKLGKILAVVLTFTLLLGAVAIASAAEGDTNTTQEQELQVSANLTLYSTFTYNIYVPQEAGDVSATIDGDEATRYTYTDGAGNKYYVFRKEGIDPTKAGESFTVVLTVKDGTTKTLDLSVLSYIKTALESNDINKASKNLVLSVLKYVHSSYVYFDPTGAESYSAVKELYDAHVATDTLYAPVYNGESMEDVKEWIASGCLNLNENPAFRFYVTGEDVKATVTYVFNGKTVTKTFNKDNFSSVGERYYFEVALRAYEFAQVLKVEVGGAVGTYSLGAYYQSEAVQTNEKLQTLVKSLNTYSKGADVYKNINNKNLSDDVKLEYEKVLLDVALPTKVTEAGSFELPNAGDTSNATITWALKEASDYAAIVDGKLVVTIPERDAETVITLVATLTLGEETDTKEFTFTIKNNNPLIAIPDANQIATDAGKDGTADKYLVEGVITNIANDYYGNMTIADAEGNTLYVYGVKSADGSVQYGKMEEKPQVGDTVRLLGKLGTHDDAPQMQEGWLMLHTPKVWTDAEKVAETEKEINIQTKFEQDGTITLPATSSDKRFDSVTISWTKDGEAYTESTLAIVQTNQAQTIVLVATIKSGNFEKTMTFNVEVDYKRAYEYVLVTDVSDLKAGDKIVIVAKGSAVALSTTQNGNNRGQANVTKNDDGTVTFGSDVQVLTLGVSEGAWTLYTGDGYLYAASTSGNQLKTQATLDNNGKWTIEIAADGIATIKSVGNTSRGWMRYNSSSSLFACYGSGQQDIVIYKAVELTNDKKIDATVSELPVLPEVYDDDATVTLPAKGTKYDDVTIEWTLNGEACDKLEIVQNDVEQILTLVATIKSGAEKREVTYTITVAPKAAVNVGSMLQDTIEEVQSLQTVYEENATITLPTSGNEFSDVQISWTKDGEACTELVIKQTTEDQKIELTATLTLDGATEEVTVTITVKKLAPKWVLVTDASQLTGGAQIVIVANGSAVALSTTQNGNNRGQANVTKNDDGTVTFGSDVQVLTLGVSEGAWTLYTGDGYLYAASTSGNQLKTQATLDNNGKWTIEIAADGIATVKSVGNTSRGWMRYNSTSSLFACYAETSTQKDIAIYMLEGSGNEGGDTPGEEVVTDSEKVEATKGELNIPTSFAADGTIDLPAKGTQYSEVGITWTAGGEAVTDTYTVTQTDSVQEIKLIATITCGKATETKEYTITVAAKAAAGTVEDRTYNFSTITGSKQYADETHALDNDVTLKITDCHINSQLRIYSSTANNGIAIIESTKVITKIIVNVGYKADALNVYGSIDGVTWVKVGSIDTTTTYADKTLDIPESAGYKYLKLDVAGTQQVRIKTMTLTLKG